ncbi:MAG: UDP-N-acetylglucosamine 2-epimerase (non-hydrolyzing) [Bacteroidetes bacterium]|nr:MAG: UDP-N-acetylglucosamine 2-epimerase (non-hydrolyzing) [Bacteroidota bacterium]REK04912.1 MAG: UDP-N-acetylglucosamine 2-epimerase (non-hydrolyzing) [Bacteroidota bacterium]REK32861.1 MAG: UDP-N-acetylglucosamine 2-epimerase (non-hydrolyzing) [Bacteroidota bacterium]REK50950.1 MAG: UDP-N-acetylglucosamine 2-epimerase (non-hydrolyzing) [Bacteroidota bacterium]
MSVKIPNLLFIFGTRPEAIKLAPLIKEFAGRKGFVTKICVTAQHREMLDQVLEFFELAPEYDLNIMKRGQSLFDVTVDGLRALEKVFDEANPDLVFVQGDTTTSFIGALAAYYKKIPVAHIEAGLRSGNKYSPFPEEMNRVLASHLSDYHFTPTRRSVGNLEKENIRNHLYKVGNTVIDALFLGLDLIRNKGEEAYQNHFPMIRDDRKIVLVTGHRRESFGGPFEDICNAIRIVAEEYPEVDFIYPVHLNPNVQEPVMRLLKGLKNVHLIAPLDYPYFIWLMSKSYIVLTDSGGLQEEAPSLGKPVLVMRQLTERQEGVDAGTAKLVGSDRDKIITELKTLLDDKSAYESMAKAVNPYGDGTTSKQIADIVESIFRKK